MTDGQDGYSRGLKIEELAKLFADLGCKAAYNLDGGASAVMTFNDAIYSRPSNGGRALGDALLIKELDGIGEEKQNEISEKFPACIWLSRWP